MHCLDLISGPPKFFIFQKESNKTNLGGVLFFIYSLIVIIITLFYIHNYSKADIYSFSSYEINGIAITEEEKNKRLNSSFYNPAFDFSFELENSQDEILSSKFIIYDTNQKHKEYFLERSKWYKRNVNDIQLAIFYDCNPNNCSSIKESDLFPTFFSYYFTMRYKGPFLAHYDKYPINNIIDRFNNNSFISNKYSFSFNTPTFYSIFWESIEYNDQIGIFDKLFDRKRKNKYVGGDFLIS